MDFCPVCMGTLWVCEDHPELPWDGEGACGCGAAGAPCVCNPEVRLEDGFVIIAGDKGHGGTPAN